MRWKCPLEATIIMKQATDAGGGTAEIWTCSMHPQIRQMNRGNVLFAKWI
ncbi:MAG: hypothetical protein R2788_12680 [Saprospiraceae bacterium]